MRKYGGEKNSQDIVTCHSPLLPLLFPLLFFHSRKREEQRRVPHRIRQGQHTTMHMVLGGLSLAHYSLRWNREAFIYYLFQSAFLGGIQRCQVFLSELRVKLLLRRIFSCLLSGLGTAPSLQQNAPSALGGRHPPSWAGHFQAATFARVDSPASIFPKCRMSGSFGFPPSRNGDS